MIRHLFLAAALLALPLFGASDTPGTSPDPGAPAPILTPEPGTWVMMVTAGAIMGGSHLWSKRRKGSKR